MSVYKDSGIRLPWRPWMAEPCYMCGREIAKDEYRWCDCIAQLVACERCTHGTARIDGQEFRDSGSDRPCVPPRATDREPGRAPTISGTHSDGLVAPE